MTATKKLSGRGKPPRPMDDDMSKSEDGEGIRARLTKFVDSLRSGPRSTTFLSRQAPRIVDPGDVISAAVDELSSLGTTAGRDGALSAFTTTVSELVDVAHAQETTNVGWRGRTGRTQRLIDSALAEAARLHTFLSDRSRRDPQPRSNLDDELSAWGFREHELPLVTDTVSGLTYSKLAQLIGLPDESPRQRVMYTGKRLVGRRDAFLTSILFSDSFLHRGVLKQRHQASDIARRAVAALQFGDPIVLDPEPAANLPRRAIGQTALCSMTRGLDLAPSRLVLMLRPLFLDRLSRESIAAALNAENDNAEEAFFHTIGMLGIENPQAGHPCFGPTDIVNLDEAVARLQSGLQDYHREAGQPLRVALVSYADRELSLSFAE